MKRRRTDYAEVAAFVPASDLYDSRDHERVAYDWHQTRIRGWLR